MLLDEQVDERLLINPAQGLDLVDADALVHLVDRRVDRTELDDLRADVGEETPVGGAAGGRDFGLDAGDGLDRAADRVHQVARLGEKGPAVVAPFEVVLETVLVEYADDA